MPIELTSLTSLPQSAVDEQILLMEQFVAERLPLADTRGGVLQDVVVMLNGTLATVAQQNIDRLRRSGSLLEISQDPTLADDELVDRVLSNFMISRRAATNATGIVTIVLDSLFPVNIPAGSQFETNGYTFTADESYAAKTSSANVVSSTDRLLLPVGDGTFAFQVAVTASSPGVVGVKQGSAVSLAARPPRFVKAYAERDFNDGLNQETTSELIQRLQLGLSAKTIAGRTHITSLIYSQPEFEPIVGISVIGFGDAEMQRDKIGIMEVSVGGRADLYIKSRHTPLLEPVVRSATLISKTVEGYGIWQASFSRDIAAGVYDITQINLATEPSDRVGGFAVTQDLRSKDTTTGIYVPDIRKASDAVYSRYQTITVQFEDTTTITDTLTVNVSAQDYRFFLRRMPLVSELQAYLGQRSILNPAGDVLVRSAVPCFLTINLTLQRRGNEVIDTPTLKAAIALTVNQTSFPTKIYASSIIETITSILPKSVGVVNCDLFGKIRRPDGEIVFVRNSEVVAIPQDPQHGVTGRTTTFFTNPEDIGITIEAAATPEV